MKYRHLNSCYSILKGVLERFRNASGATEEYVYTKSLQLVLFDDGIEKSREYPEIDFWFHKKVTVTEVSYGGLYSDDHILINNLIAKAKSINVLLTDFVDAIFCCDNAPPIHENSFVEDNAENCLKIHGCIVAKFTKTEQLKTSDKLHVTKSTSCIPYIPKFLTKKKYEAGLYDGDMFVTRYLPFKGNSKKIQSSFSNEKRGVDFNKSAQNSLVNSKWVADSVLDGWNYALKEMFLEIENCTFTTVMQVQHLLSSESPERKRKHNDDKKKLNKFIIIPYREGDAHWVLLIIIGEYNEHDEYKISEIIIYDSLRNDDKRVALQTEIKKSISLTRLHEKKGPQTFLNKLITEQDQVTWRYPEVTQQKDSYNCGIFVCWYLYAIYKHYHVDRIPLDVLFESSVEQTLFTSPTKNIEPLRNELLKFIRASAAGSTISASANNFCCASIQDKGAFDVFISHWNTYLKGMYTIKERPAPVLFSVPPADNDLISSNAPDDRPDYYGIFYVLKTNPTTDQESPRYTFLISHAGKDWEFEVPNNLSQDKERYTYCACIFNKWLYGIHDDSQIDVNNAAHSITYPLVQAEEIGGLSVTPCPTEFCMLNDRPWYVNKSFWLPFTFYKWYGVSHYWVKKNKNSPLDTQQWDALKISFVGTALNYWMLHERPVFFSKLMNDYLFHESQTKKENEYIFYLRQLESMTYPISLSKIRNNKFLSDEEKQDEIFKHIEMLSQMLFLLLITFTLNRKGITVDTEVYEKYPPAYFSYVSEEEERYIFFITNVFVKSGKLLIVDSNYNPVNTPPSADYTSTFKIYNLQKGEPIKYDQKKFNDYYKKFTGEEIGNLPESFECCFIDMCL